jgi:CheY-like chemotaxis protein
VATRLLGVGLSGGLDQRRDLSLETFALPPLIDGVVKTIEPLAAKNGNQVHEIVRRGVRQALEPIGWKVTEAENGQVAVDSLIAARPDVIILDLMMPKMDGFEFLDELRGRPDWQTSRSWS